MGRSLAAASVFLVSIAATPIAASAYQAQQDDPNRVICRSERFTGSRIASRAGQKSSLDGSLRTIWLSAGAACCKARKVMAHTLAESNASTDVLEQCGFRRAGEIVDPEDGAGVTVGEEPILP